MPEVAIPTDSVVVDFIHRLQSGQMDGQFTIELGKLSYSQLLTVASVLTRYQIGGSSTTDTLTPRQRQILALIASGKSSRQIASHLGIAFKTVVCHRYHLQAKLNAHNTADLTRAALRMGLAEL